MKKTFFILASTILLLSLVSASPLSDFMSSDVSNITITITQDTAVSEFSIDTSGYAWDTQNVGAIVGEEDFFMSFSEILGGINFGATFSDGATHPVFSDVIISEADVLNILNNLGTGVDFAFGDNTPEFNNLADDITSPAMVGNSYFVKDGINYEIGYDSGFGDIPDNYKDSIEDAIVKGVNSMSISSLIEEALLLDSISDYLPILENLSFEVTGVEFEDAIEMIPDFNVSVDLTSLPFQDGEYEIPVTITSLSGGESVTKTITLVLDGIVNYEDGNVDSSGIYIPTGLGVAEIIEQIASLPNGALVTISSSDVKPFGVSVPSSIDSVKFLEIEVDQITDGEIFFNILASSVSNPNKIHLYVLEGSNWVELATSYLGVSGLFYEFSAYTPHFSTFMIGEDTSSSSSSDDEDDEQYNGGIGRRNPVVVAEQNNEAAPLEPIALGNPAPITGGVIGSFLKSGAGVASVIVVVAIAALGVVLVSFNKRKLNVSSSKK